MTILAIDNGSTGSISILSRNLCLFTSMPTKDGCHTKTGKVYQRVDVEELKLYIDASFALMCCPLRAYIERPFTGSSMMIAATVLAARAHEATVIALEQLGIGYETVDSKAWQAAMLPGIKGSPLLKRASLIKGTQLYPRHAAAIKQHGDADSLLMAHFYSGHGSSNQ